MSKLADRCPGRGGYSWVVGLTLAMTLAISAVPLSAQSYVIGRNFTGLTISASIPPDTMGTVGQNHIVELINDNFAVYNKSGTQLLKKTDLKFWQDAGLSPAGNAPFDPRVLYDPHTSRYFAAGVDWGGATNNVLVAVSDSSDPTGSWSGYTFAADTTGSRWADFPTFGMNGSGLYIAANMVNSSGNLDKTSVYAIDKAQLLNGTLSVSRNENLNPNNKGYSIQPIVDMDSATGSNPMLSSYNKASGSLKRTDISTSSLSTTGGFISVTARSGPPDAAQPGTKNNLETSDSRFSGNAVLQNGSIWAVQAVEVSGRSAIEWYEIRESDNTVLQSGLIDDATRDLFFPSIAVNDDATVVIGFSISGENLYASSGAVVGETTSGSTSFTAPIILKQGQADYQRLDTQGRNRWGDYSATVVDPNDPTRFWTFQEYASAPIGGWSSDVWATQITEIVVPEPATMSLLALGGLALLIRRHRRG